MGCTSSKVVGKPTAKATDANGPWLLGNHHNSGKKGKDAQKSVLGSALSLFKQTDTKSGNTLPVASSGSISLGSTGPSCITIAGDILSYPVHQTGPMVKSATGLVGLEWPAEVGPSSRVIKTPVDWCDKGILVPHEAFRWLHTEIRKILACFDPLVPGQDWKTKVFFNWLDRYYIQAIHHHHQSEEEIYNPAIIAEGGVLPPKITSDHGDIIARLALVSSFRTRIEAGEEAALIEFKDHLRQLIDTIDDHLAEEEEAYPSALRSSTMTEAEEKAVVDKIIQSMGLDGNKVLLPPILYAMHMWAGEQAAEEMVNVQLPAPIRFAFTHFWVPDFQANSLAVISALQGTEAYQPSHPQCEICTVM